MNELPGPGQRIRNIVEEALTARGFSPAEAGQMILRLMKYGEGAVYHGQSIYMPFGKYKGWSVDEVPSEYLYWLTAQDWFRGNYYDLYNTVADTLECRKR